jgi:hypothetical protein
LSSFQPDKINNKPPYKMNSIDNIPATKTKIDMISNTKSPNSIFCENNAQAG